MGMTNASAFNPLKAELNPIAGIISSPFSPR